MRRRFRFESEGETLVGNLFLPESSTPAGVVIAVGPLTSVKEQAAGTYAQAMAELVALQRQRRRRQQVRGAEAAVGQVCL